MADLKVLHSKRGSIKAQLTYFTKHFEKVRVLSVTQAIIDELQNRLNKLELLWEPFNELQADIEASAVDVESEYEQREMFQDLYFQTVTSAQQFISSSTPDGVDVSRSHVSSSAHSCNIEMAHSIKLPTINLPTFDGNFTQWREFFDTFKAIVHSNSNISNAQKLCYLRSALVGDASSVVRSFETTDANYGIVWELLQKRYDNKRRIVANHSRALLELPSVVKESHGSYRQLIDAIQRHVRCLQALEQPVDSWDAILVPLIATKLDPVANREWEAKINSELSSRDDIPTLDELITFLTHKHDTLEAIVASRTPVEPTAGTASGRNKENRIVQKRSYVASDISCSFCQGSHQIRSCEEFLKFTPEARLDQAKKSNLCINCLCIGHRVSKCTQGNCRKCKSRHHTLLHFDKPKQVQSDQPSQTSTSTSTLTSQVDSNSKQVLLATVEIAIEDSKGKLHIGRALLDSGSQSNFITNEFCNLLGLERIFTEVAILGLNQTTTNTRHRCNVTMQSRNKKFSMQSSCLVVPQISDILPCTRIQVAALGIPKHIKLADPQFDKPGKIDVLLGAEYFWQLLCIGQVKLQNSQLIMQKTKFGWILSGPININSKTQTRCNLSQNIEIQERTEVTNWRHIKSKDNPADLLSVSPTILKSSELWWHGPSWLMAPRKDWPVSHIQSSQNMPELKIKTKTFVVTNDLDILFTKYSSLMSLQRVTAYCFRFYNNAKLDKSYRAFNLLSVSELQNALISLIKLSQLQHFGEEIRFLNENKSLKSNSKLLNLNPFLDQQGLLRVGGRLRNSNYNFEKRCPIILSPRHNLSNLIAKHEHCRLLHCGPQALLYSLRETYWPLSGRNFARKIVRECLVCFRNNPQPSRFIMGDLPKERVTPAPPFRNTGVDYAGPLLIRDRRARGYKTSKAYICLFVCFVTKAIHLELVGDLTSECFLAAFRRFAARRGKPNNIYSDNGTNFVGANNELRDLGHFLLKFGNKIKASAVPDKVVWHFIPAHSPHFGGLWKAGVKSVKHHLKRVIGNALLTYEELCTTLAQIEAVLNSRPLSPLSTDPNDLSPLTPAHFLIGRPLTALPDPDVRHIPENRLSRFQLLQNINQHFWARWSEEYVSEMQLRTKWKKAQPTIALDALVIIKEDNLPPLCWRLGRITQLHPGLDGVVRVVSVKTSKGILKRAVSKICPFPVQSDKI